MRTTPEQRARFVAWLHDPSSDRMSVRAWAVGEDMARDLDEALAQLRASHEVLADLRAMTATSQREVALLAEVAALRAVAEAAKQVVRGREEVSGGTWGLLLADEDALREALRAWEERSRG